MKRSKQFARQPWDIIEPEVNEIDTGSDLVAQARDLETYEGDLDSFSLRLDIDGEF